ncbi:MAG TPA: pyridoxamine 5'-phosphate oxidase family protein [Acidobacteriota bacterium]|nr:pyridoxamine 5'-phosphate oxidase family protein [Acidobacteriota bacterium]
MSKRERRKTNVAKETAPIAQRPVMPAEYGVPRDAKGLLPWSHVDERMASASCYWVTTVSPDGHPHATPVDGIWMDNRLYFGGSPKTRRNRNLASSPATCIHLESGKDVVILHGESRELRAPGQVLGKRLAEASKVKYGYGWKPEDYEKTPGMFVFQPRTVLAWKKFPRDATRWRLPL